MSVKKRRRVIALNDKNMEVADFLPNRYVGLLFNTLISKGVDDGTLIQELSAHLASDELKKIADSLEERFGIAYESKDRPRGVKGTDIGYRKKISKRKEFLEEPKDDLSLFFGFDE